MKEVVDAAESFDKLVLMPGWEKVLLFLANQVQKEISESTIYKYEPQRQQVHVIRWDAKRELLDDAIAYVQGTQDERDRIVSEFRERQEMHV